ncbi:parallel beta helix pectate lyase-like protein [Saccharothrix carnea]|uniref:Parallel beta helix pectate lyase-like protein n=1 Tax=Saccharothrix carnea TaxID=1280637 RepID=A0A2P8I7M4_SACCR|nr:right-handed parallel beta-helix repeat-containing protein [Saccharothrix carnea]PSL54472.1 parallel beta helix pectate lyase-like protein [Saccharothrix carnea]
MTDFHVSPAGDDSAAGTADHPFRTLERARRAAREVGGDVTVHLRAGTHVLTEPFELTEEDSQVVYQAFGYGTDAREDVVVSGGREVAGRRGPDGVWVAEVGDLVTRHLVVNGRRVERAGVDGLPGTVRRTPTGYATDAPLNWRNTSGVEFVHRGVYPWTEARTAVASVRPDGEITMAQPAFGWAVDVYNSEWFGQTMSGPPAPTRVENDPAFLTGGTFALDRSRPGRHVLHYLPLPDEEPHVVAPVLEVLVRATGVRDVTFRGVVFADTTWLRPGSDRGFLHYHSNGYYDGGRIGKVEPAEGAWLTVPEETEQIPACVRLDGTTGVRFEGCRFTRLGATGLGATGGADLVVRGCDFDALAASAIAVTGTRKALVEDNLVRHVGLDHSGSAGITFLDTEDCVVTHNHVHDVPHNGIVAGPARGGTRVTRNLVTRTMGVLADGGGVYLSGPQGSAGHGAVISGNVIEDTRTPYNFGLYTDYGATWVEVEGNVVVRADNTSVLHVYPPLEHVTYRGNFWDADPVGSDAVPDGVTYEGNTTITDQADLAAATAEVRARAGLLTARG